MLKKVKSWLGPAFKLLFAAGLIYWLVSSGRFNLAELTALLRPSTLLIAVGLIGINLWMLAERWRSILLSQYIELPSLECMKLTLIGSFFNFVVPGGVGGDVVKGYFIVRDNPQARLKAGVTVAMDRLLGLFTMALMALASILIEIHRVMATRELQVVGIFLALVCVGFAVFWALIFSRRLSGQGWVERLLDRFPFSQQTIRLYGSFADYKYSKHVFFRALWWSLAAQVVVIFFFMFIGGQASMSDIAPSIYFFVVPIGFMVTALPISPAGVGVGQAAFYFLFSLAIGSKTSIGSTAITALQVCQFAWGLFGAFFYISRPKPVAAE